MLPQELIRTKRDGGTLAADEIRAFVAGVADGSIGDGQVAALAMAVFFNGMDVPERTALTLAMRDSGDTLDWSGEDLPGPVVDKHSTGGVGDLVSLPLGPMVAACGGFVPMISGRGLGHTGGTLDKFDSIPGYSVTPDNTLFRKVVRDVGVAIIGQTARLAPADGRIYSIRDVTATVESVALITASILAKKLAAGLQALAMDVKVGSGAFMPTHAKSLELARSIVDVGNAAGMRTSAILTDMNQSLAPVAGNALEVRAAIDYLTGVSRPARLHEVVLALAGRMLTLGGLARDAADARAQLEQALASGAATERFARMVAALGGPSDLVENPQRHLAPAPVVRAVPAPRAGIVANIHCRALGLAVVGLGGGRRRPEDKIDPAVGLTGIVELGTTVAAGDPLAVVHARREADADAAVAEILAAIEIGEASPTLPPTLYEQLD